MLNEDELREVFGCFSVQIASGEEVITNDIVEDRLLLFDDDPCSQDRAFLEFVDKLFEMLDADGDGNVSFTEFQMAFIVHPELMSKIFVEGPTISGQPSGSIDTARSIFRKHARGSATLPTQYCSDLIQEQFAAHVGHDPDQLATISSAFLGLLGVNPDSGETEVTQAAFLRAYMKNRDEMTAIFGDADPRDPQQKGWTSESAFGEEETDPFHAATASGAFDEIARTGSPNAIDFMSPKKVEALRGVFNAADEDGGGTIGPQELLRVLGDEQLGGVLAKQMRSSFGSFSERFVQTMLQTLDRNGDGNFDFNEFCTAFGPVISDEGQYVPEKSVTGAQLHALTQEYRILSGEKNALEERLEAAESEFEHKLHLITSDMHERERITEQAEDEAGRLQQRLARAEQELSSRKKTMDHMEERLAAAQDEASDMRKKADAAVSENRRLQSANTHLDSEVHNLSRKLDEAEKRVAELEEMAQNTREARTLHAADTGAELSVVKEDLRAAQAEIEDLIRHQSTAQGEIDHLRESLNKKKAEFRLLSVQLEQKEEEANDLSRDLERAKTALKRQESDFNDRFLPLKERLQQDVLGKERELAEAHESIADLKEQIKAAERAQADAERRARDADASATGHERGVASQIDALKERELSLMDQLSTLQQQSAESAKAATSAQKDFAMYVHNHEEQVGGMKQQLRALLDELAKAKAALTATAQDLDEQVRGFETTKNALEKQILEQSQQIEAIQKEFADQAAELAAKTAQSASEAESLSKNESELRSKLSETESALAKAQTAITSLQKAIDDMKETAQEQDSEIEALKSKIAQLQKTNTALSAAIQTTVPTLEQHLSDDRLHGDRVKKSLERLDADDRVANEGTSRRTSMSEGSARESIYSDLGEDRSIYGSSGRDDDREHIYESISGAVETPTSDADRLPKLASNVLRSSSSTQALGSDLLRRLQDSQMKCKQLAQALEAAQRELADAKAQTDSTATAAKERETELVLKLAASTRSASDAAHRREAELLEQLADTTRKHSEEIKAAQADISKVREDARKREQDLLSQISELENGLEQAKRSLEKKAAEASSEDQKMREALDKATRSANLMEEALDKASQDLSESRRANSELQDRLDKANIAGSELLREAAACKLALQHSPAASVQDPPVYEDLKPDHDIYVSATAEAKNQLRSASTSVASLRASLQRAEDALSSEKDAKAQADRKNARLETSLSKANSAADRLRRECRAAADNFEEQQPQEIRGGAGGYAVLSGAHNVNAESDDDTDDDSEGAGEYETPRPNPLSSHGATRIESSDYEDGPVRRKPSGDHDYESPAAVRRRSSHVYEYVDPDEEAAQDKFVNATEDALGLLRRITQRAHTSDQKAAALQAKLSGMKKSKGALTEKSAEMAAELAREQAKSVALERELGAQREAVADQKESRDALVDQNRQLTREVATLNTKIREVEQERASLMAAKSRAEAECARLKRENTTGYNDVLNLRSRVAELEAILATKDTQIADAEEEIHDLKRDFQRQRDIAAATASQNLAAASISADQRVADLEGDLDAAKARAEQLRIRHDKLVQELADAEEENEELEAALTQAQALAEQNSKNKSMVDSKVAALQRRVIALNGEVDEAIHARDSERDRSHRLERDLSAFQLRVKELELEATRAREALSEAEIQARSRRAKSDVGDRIAQITGAVDGLHKNNNAESALKAQLERARMNARSLEEELEEIQQNQNDEVRKRHKAEAELRAALDKLETSNSRARSLELRVNALATVETRCTELESNVTQLRAERDAMQGRAAATSRGLGDFDDEDETNGRLAESEALVKGLRAALQSRNVQVRNLQASVKDLLHRWPQEAPAPTPPQSPPVIRTETKYIEVEADRKEVVHRSRTHRNPVLRLDNVQLVSSELSSRLRFPKQVDVEVNQTGVTVIGGGVAETWPFGVLKRYGLESGVCSLEFGGAPDLSGVLFFAAGRERGELLFRTVGSRLEAGPPSTRPAYDSDVHTFSGVAVLESPLSKELGLPRFVTVQLGPGRLRIKDTSGQTVDWRSRDIKTCDAREGVCTVKLGRNPSTSEGTLHLRAGPETGPLLRALLRVADGP